MKPLTVRKTKGYALETLYESSEHELEPARLVYVSFTAPKSNAYTIVRALSKGEPAVIGDRKCDKIRLKFEKAGFGRLRRFIAPLSQSCGSHAICIHPLALNDCGHPEYFYHLSRSHRPHTGRFFLQLNQASRVPMLPIWSNYLWKEGTANGWIVKLSGEGEISGWVVKPNERILQSVISRGIKKGVIPIGKE